MLNFLYTDYEMFLQTGVIMLKIYGKKLHFKSENIKHSLYFLVKLMKL